MKTGSYNCMTVNIRHEVTTFGLHPLSVTTSQIWLHPLFMHPVSPQSLTHHCATHTHTQTGVARSSVVKKYQYTSILDI